VFIELVFVGAKIHLTSNFQNNLDKKYSYSFLYF